MITLPRQKPLLSPISPCYHKYQVQNALSMSGWTTVHQGAVYGSLLTAQSVFIRHRVQHRNYACSLGI